MVRKGWLCVIRLYRFIEKNLGNDYRDIYYESCDESVANNVVITIYGGQGVKKTISGAKVYESLKCTVTVLVGPGDASISSEDAIQKAHSYLRKFVDRVESDPIPLEGFDVLGVQCMGNPSRSIGRNGYGLMQVVTNIEIKCII